MEGIKMRARFRNEALDQQFEKDGYVLIRNFVNADQVSKMLGVFNETYADPSSKCNLWNHLGLLSESERMAVSERLMEHIRPSVEKHFYDCETFFSFFLTKPTNQPPTEVPIHSDSSALDEGKYEYLTTWMPLIDVTRKNGCLYVIPRSKGIISYCQPLTLEFPYPGVIKSLKRYAVDIPMKAGDLLIFSSKTLHGSYPNRSQNPRPAIQSVLLYPKVEIFYHYYDKEKNLINTYQVDNWFYLKNQFEEPVGKYPLKASFTYSPPPLSVDDIKKYYAKNPVKIKNFSGFLRRIGINV